MQDVLHPIFDVAYDVLGAETFELDTWAEDQIKEALEKLSTDETHNAAIALCALAEVVGPHNAKTAEGLRALAKPLSTEVVRALPRHAATEKAGKANAAYSQFLGAGGPKYAPRAAPEAGTMKVGLGVRFRLNQ